MKSSDIEVGFIHVWFRVPSDGDILLEFCEVVSE